MQKYDIVALGGTFDIIHDGHMKLLNKAFSISNKAIIGLTSDELAAKKGKKRRRALAGKFACELTGKICPSQAKFAREVGHKPAKWMKVGFQKPSFSSAKQRVFDFA